MKQLFNEVRPPSTPGASAVPMEDILMTEPGLNSFFDPLENINRKFPDQTMYEDSQYVDGKLLEPLRKSFV